MVRVPVTGTVESLEKWPYTYPLKDFTEGTTTFKVLDTSNIYDAPAFFNPVMCLNRDLSLLNVWVHHKERGRKLRIFEPLAGIGVRGFRLINEVNEAIEKVVINDFGEISTDLARYNRTFIDDSKLIQYKREARALAASLAENSMKYHYVDLDPFGSPSPFIDSLWRIISNKGILAVTATDMTALAGVFPDAALRKYGGLPFNNDRTHETAVRLLLAMIARSAARFEKGIEPLLSISSDHYIKVFIRVHEGRGKANASIRTLRSVYFCRHCQYFSFDNMDCHFSYHQNPAGAGPLWGGSIFNKDWCEKGMAILHSLNLPTTKKIEKILSEGVEGIDIPYYYSLDQMASYLHVNTPKTTKLIEKLTILGYKALKTTYRKQALRTDAPYWILEKAIKGV